MKLPLVKVSNDCQLLQSCAYHIKQPYQVLVKLQNMNRGVAIGECDPQTFSFSCPLEAL